MKNVINLGTNIEHLPQLYVEFERKIKIRRPEKMESILVIHLLYFIRKEIIFRKGMYFGIDPSWTSVSGTPLVFPLRPSMYLATCISHKNL